MVEAALTQIERDAPRLIPPLTRELRATLGLG
jgi:hypothetical protein